MRVDCFFMGKVEKLSPEARYFFHLLKPGPTPLKKPADLAALRKSLKGCDWVVDGLFGTGLNRRLKGLFAQVLKQLNISKGRKFAIDMPSGVSGDSGKVMGEAFRAVLRAKPGGVEGLRCGRELVRWAVKNWRLLLSDLDFVVREILHFFRPGPPTAGG